MKEIILSQGKVALVDDEDFEFVSQWKWHAHKKKNTWYARRSIQIDGGQKAIRMHREIMDAPANMEVDHKNHDGLDNRRDNLRVCSHKENGCNRRAAKGGSSKYLGVSKQTQTRKGKTYSYWLAQIQHNGKRKYVGSFPLTPEGELHAADAYNSAARKIHAEFANLNATHLSQKSI